MKSGMACLLEKRGIIAAARRDDDRGPAKSTSPRQKARRHCCGITRSRYNAPGARRRTGLSPTRSGPEGSSRNELRPGSPFRSPTPARCAGSQINVGRSIRPRAQSGSRRRSGSTRAAMDAGLRRRTATAGGREILGRDTGLAHECASGGYGRSHAQKTRGVAHDAARSKSWAVRTASLGEARRLQATADKRVEAISS